MPSYVFVSKYHVSIGLWYPGVTKDIYTLVMHWYFILKVMWTFKYLRSIVRTSCSILSYGINDDWYLTLMSVFCFIELLFNPAWYRHGTGSREY